MKPVFQTKFAVPADEGGDAVDVAPEDMGNCHAACLASMLESDIDNIPELHSEGWVQRALWAVEQEGYVVVVDGPNHVNGPEWLDAGLYADGSCYLWLGDLSSNPYIALGKSPRGEWNHSAIYGDSGLIHDPNPAGGGIEGEILERWYILPRPEPES